MPLCVEESAGISTGGVQVWQRLKLYLLLVHSFILDISIAPLQVHYYSEALPTTALILCRVSMSKRYRQLRVKDLPKVCMLNWF